MAWSEHIKRSLPPDDARQAWPCNCIGPQRGEPLCPCRMRAVTIENGRYVMKQDLGPAPAAKCVWCGKPNPCDCTDEDCAP